MGKVFAVCAWVARSVSKPVSSPRYTHYPTLGYRQLCSEQTGPPPKVTNAAVKKSVDNIADKFSEALAQLADARHSAGTIYFSEDARDAEALVEETLKDYKQLMDSLDEAQRINVRRSIGLKMEELKAQMKLLKDLAKTTPK